jgi:acyl dehydratase
MSIAGAAVGQELPPLVKPPITQEQLRSYADASGDYNPIHLDEQAAHSVGLDSVIAHGMLSMAFLGQFIDHQIAGIPGARIAQLKARFINMVHLGDTLTFLGVIKAQEINDDLSQAVTIECWAQNQQGDRVTAGEALVIIPGT